MLYSTILTSKITGYQIHVIGKATRSLLLMRSRIVCACVVLCAGVGFLRLPEAGQVYLSIQNIDFQGYKSSNQIL